MGQTIQQGKASATFDQDIDQLFTGLLDNVAPNARIIMDESLKRIQTEAISQWPKRKPKLTIEDGRVVGSEERSKKSYQKFVRGFRLDADGKLVVYLKNTAPYSYVIKFGQDSRNKDGKDIIQPQGKRAAQELLIKPLNKSTRRIVKALADELFKGR